MFEIGGLWYCEAQTDETGLVKDALNSLQVWTLCLVTNWERAL